MESTVDIYEKKHYIYMHVYIYVFIRENVCMYIYIYFHKFYNVDKKRKNDIF